MTVSIGHFMALVVVGLLVVTATLQLMGSRRLSCWLLVLFPACLCVGGLVDLAHGATQIGTSAYRSDQKQLVSCLFFLAISLFAVLLSQWRWLFWLVWGLNALICGILVYLAFFWKVFS